MRSEKLEPSEYTHYRIYVYDNAAPPLGEPKAVTLCPWARGSSKILSGALIQVTCPKCLKHIDELGINWA